ncbi:DUF5671 domain-containing protein [Salinibacterium sp. SWN1162]|uniref:DUF5671 domain-containing protein n=1 Tax=Salinibacterium sp. SWN1162 TaxID=2792053 RepID=UPI0018CE4978|nr:DUF5671 domain-containing protein [Salinibacterium sp. SWN1162]MBH0008838.1 hypothetical protein [Salinibacterium sp. SWN1162]
MTSTASSLPATPALGGVHTVRRFITYALLAATVIIAASGLSGLLDRLFTLNRVEVSFDNYGLATSLASALVAGPLAALLWWLIWRDGTMARDRASVLWPVYLVIMSTVALLVFSIALLSWIADTIRYGWNPMGLAVGIVWAFVWGWHYWMWRHPAKGPTRLQGAAPALASLIGLTYGAGGLASALAQLIDAATDAGSRSVVVSDPLWQLIAQSLVWAIGGVILWRWHWLRVGVRDQTFGFSTVLLVFITGIASLAVFALGLIILLSILLELATGLQQPLTTLLDPLGASIAGIAMGALVFVYHSRIVAERSAGVRAATALSTAAVSLAFAASGFGVTVNALLATASEPLLGGNIRSLLLAGLSALVVGGVLWWLTWRPREASQPERVATPGRRVFLVIIFGLSALVALITLLVIGFQLFSFLLDGGSGESFIERSRQALGLLTATGLVAAYHFTIWRKDRATDVDVEPVHRIGRVTLVSSGSNVELVEAVRAATGARVTVLQRAEPVTREPDVAAVVAALDGVAAPHVLVVAGTKGKVAVIPLVS